MSKLDFKKISDNGDATSNYEVSIKGTLTLNDLVERVLSYEKEWGYIRIGKNWNAPKYIEYRYGKIVKDNRGEYSYSGDEAIVRMRASGGWTAMDYYVEVLHEPERR